MNEYQLTPLDIFRQEKSSKSLEKQAKTLLGQDNLEISKEKSTLQNTFLYTGGAMYNLNHNFKTHIRQEKSQKSPENPGKYLSPDLIEDFLYSAHKSLKKTLSCLLFLRDDDDMVTVSNETLAKFVGVKSRQIRKIKSKLKEQGLIEIVVTGSNFVRVNGKQTSCPNTYKVNPIFRDEFLANKLRGMKGFSEEPASDSTPPVLPDWMLASEQSAILYNNKELFSRILNANAYKYSYKTVLLRSGSKKFIKFPKKGEETFPQDDGWMPNYHLEEDDPELGHPDDYKNLRKCMFIEKIKAGAPIKNYTPSQQAWLGKEVCKEIYSELHKRKLKQIREKNIPKRGDMKPQTLTDKEVQILRSLPKEIIQFVKKELQLAPGYKNDYVWLIDKAKEASIEMDMPISHLLSIHGFEHSAKRAAPKEAKPKYEFPVKEKYTQTEAAKEIEKIMQNFSKPLPFLGKDAQEKLLQAEIDRVLSKTIEREL